MVPTEVVERVDVDTSPRVRPIFVRPEATGPVAPPRFLSVRGKTNWTRVAVLMTAGALPVSAIPLYVLGLVPMTYSALAVVVLMLVKAVLIRQGSAEGWWAGRGMAAGLVAVTAYDALRLPMSYLVGVWPDFIPRIGGWIVGSNHANAPIGYLWRYLGDGGGIAVAFFVLCGALLNVRPTLVRSHPMALALGYGVFIWLGLIATVVLPPRGEEMLFVPTAVILALSLLGHLIYGAVLGIFLSRHVRHADTAAHATPTTTRRTLPTQRTDSTPATPPPGQR